MHFVLKFDFLIFYQKIMTFLITSIFIFLFLPYLYVFTEI